MRQQRAASPEGWSLCAAGPRKTDGGTEPPTVLRPHRLALAAGVGILGAEGYRRIFTKAYERRGFE